MKNFEYIKPSTVTLASELLKGEHTAACAGETDLIDLMRNRILPEYPKRVVSLKGIEGLDYIREEHGSLLIGAMTTLNTIARSALVKEKNPMIAQAAESVASPNLRNTATIGGNLCPHHPESQSHAGHHQPGMRPFLSGKMQQGAVR